MAYKRFNPRKAHLHICPECEIDMECNPEERGIDECAWPESVLCGECIVDDGTLDTVVQCELCGKEERFDSPGLLPDNEENYTTDDLDNIRVATARGLAEQDHECS